MDKLIINNIEFIGHCGITEEERVNGQKMSADIELSLDISKAAASDNLKDTVNYVDICDKVVTIGRKETYNLLETLAERLVNEILKNHDISEVRLRIRKCSPPVDAIKGYFGVEITRQRDYRPPTEPIPFNIRSR